MFLKHDLPFLTSTVQGLLDIFFDSSLILKVSCWVFFAQGIQDIYAVNDIAFHPVHGTLATVGSDGRWAFWDKDARTKLKTGEPMEQPITCCSFNATGIIFAYAVSYDWSKGHEFYQPQKKNYIFLRQCFEELKPRATK